MADTDEFDKGTLRNATRGISGIGTTNERDAVGTVKDAYSEGKRLVSEQHIGEKARNAETFVTEKVHEAQTKVQDWKAEREGEKRKAEAREKISNYRDEQKSAADREKRKAEAREKISNYRDELETKRAEAEVKVLEAQARSLQPQGGDKFAQLRDAMINMKTEGRKMFSGPVSESMWNSRSPLGGQQTASPLMAQVMMTGRPTRGRGQGQQMISPLMSGPPRGSATAMPSLMRNASRGRLPTLLEQAGGMSRKKGSTFGGSLIGSMFGRPSRKRRR